MSMVLLNFVDQREDIAHAEDALGDAIRIEGFEGIALFTDADKFERLAGDGGGWRGRRHRGRRHPFW